MPDVLVVDDEMDIRNLISELLLDEGCTVRTSHDADAVFAAIEAHPPDLIILDIWLQGSQMDGIEILKSVKYNNPSIPVVIISGHGNIEMAVAAVKQGAYDFIEKPFNIDQLLVVINRALEANRLRRENARLKIGCEDASDLIGFSSVTSAHRQRLDRVARSDSRVLLTGGPGTGKEISARYIHYRSKRWEKPFVVVNAASINPDRMEETLFGTEAKGNLHLGLFEQANGGTLFIDEVSEMPKKTQSKILRVLIDQAFNRFGGQTTVRVDVRVISATNRNLQSEINAERFRQDLYHRLNVVAINVPTLETRREDIPELASYFLDIFAQEQGLTRRNLSPEAIVALQTRNWPGNVRELRNLMERVLILGNSCAPIEAEELHLCGGDDANESGLSNTMNLVASLPLKEAREFFEREYLVAQINRFGGNISKTANFVSMERSALHRKLKMLDVITTSKNGTRIALSKQDEIKIIRKRK